MDIKSIISEVASIISTRFMIMMVFIALILIFYDSKILDQEGATKDSKMAKYWGITYLFLGIGLYIAVKIF